MKKFLKKILAKTFVNRSPCLFPPVNSGGLIEAVVARRLGAGRAEGFPPVNSGGLIEAARSTGTPAGSLRRFPPVNSGGLIEAVALSGARPTNTRLSFRR